MRRKTILKVEHWFGVIAYWIIVFYLYYIIVFWGVQDLLSENPIKAYLNTNYVHVEILLQAVLFGTLFYLISIFIDNSRIKRKSFGIVILTQSALYAFSIAIAAVIVYFIFLNLKIYPEKELYVMQEMMSHHFFVSLVLYIAVAILALNFIMEVDKKFGPGNLFKLFIGKYHNPREEKRIFMFLDLKNSTGITEKLGHRVYSRFIRDCFHDLTDLIIRYRAEIYQFVGDEVVLTWTLKNGLKKQNCLTLFFAYKNHLEENAEHYLKNYKTSPCFKAGMDVGLVTVAEIGDIKREIAYHGDALNTAARIQEQCKIYDKQLLISQKLNEILSEENRFIKLAMGNLKLRGKNNDVNVVSVEMK